MSEDLRERFQQATQDVKTLGNAPDNVVLLQLYSLYKQGTMGDCTGKRPGFIDMVGRAKYDAWKSLEGTSQDEAMQRYIDLVAELKGKDRA